MGYCFINFKPPMKKQLNTEIIISSTPEIVWEILTGFDKYPDWNPFIRYLKGNKDVGEQLIVRLQPPDSKEVEFKPVILKYKKNEELRWKGKLGINGIFDGEHYFMLVDLDNGQTRFIHGEKFGGILVPFMEKTFIKTKKGFEMMNQALKEQCEKAASPKKVIPVRKSPKVIKKNNPKKL
jgi:hypothetical protein